MSFSLNVQIQFRLHNLRVFFQNLSFLLFELVEFFLNLLLFDKNFVQLVFY